MSDYIYDIKMAAILFPFIAFIISFPFILINYHKYGSVNFFKSTVAYSFVLYMLCAYFLVILPLPDRAVVAKLTTPMVQFVPFAFLIDIIKNFELSFSFLTTSYVYIPIFNIILTIPFGVYLRYYFKCSLKKTILLTFLLSLFFELTQLSGLYFIYARSYRLCDIDDLLQNTLGGTIGYFVGGLFAKILPSIDKVNLIATQKGMEVSGFKRFTSLVLDFIIISIMVSIVNIFWNNEYVFMIITILYFLITPFLTKGCTLAQKWLNLKVVDNKDKFNILRTILRYISFALIYIVIPLGFIKCLFALVNYKNIYENMYVNLIIFGICGIIGVLYVIIMFKYVFTRRTMLHEKISKTKLVSTIKVKKVKVK